MQNMDFSTTTFHFGNMIDSASCLQCQDAEQLRVHEKGNCSPGFFQVTHFRNFPGRFTVSDASRVLNYVTSGDPRVTGGRSWCCLF